MVEGLSFHVGSQCTNFDNFVQALNIAAAVMEEARSRGHEIKILDIGGGFPAPYDKHVKPFSELARKINAEIDRLFAHEHRDPGRAGALSGGHRRHRRIARSSARPCATARPCYYIDDSVYHTFCGIIFDHCQYH